MDNANNNSNSQHMPKSSFLKQLRLLPKHVAPLISVLKLATRVSPGLLVIMVCLNIAISVIPAGMIYVGKVILDLLVYNVAHHGNSLKPLFIWVSVECFLRFAQIALTQSSTLYNQKFANRLQLRIQQDFFAACARQAYHHFENPEFYQKLQLMIGRVFYGATSYLMTLIAWFRTLIQFVSIFALLADINIFFLIVIIALNILAFAGNCKRIKKSFSKEQELTKKQRKISYLFQLLTSDTWIRDLKLFGAELFFQKRYLNDYQELQKDRQKIMKNNQQFGSFMEIITTISYYAFYIYIIYGVIKLRLTVGDISLYQRSYTALDSNISNFLNSFTSIYENNLYFQQYFDFIAPETSHEKKSHFERPVKKIEIKNLCFRYPGATHATLRHINFQAKAGEIIAIVGQNGCGKTTLMKILSGLYPCARGEIYINDQDLTQLETASYQAGLGVIFQDFNRYALSLHDNIICGSTEHADDATRLTQAIVSTRLENVLSNLANGEETILSKSYEHGQQPSSGEWQKIALSRLFFRNPDVLILDEALANLDNINAQHMIEALKTYAQKNCKILILIGHQLHNLQFASTIYVMSEGQIVEHGTHEKLLALHGKYHELWANENCLV